MGGIWEFLIKSIKRSLKPIIKDIIFTKDYPHTFLCEVESVLSGRPLTAISDNITYLEPLTLNHLLIGFSLSNVSPGNFNSDEINLRKKWRSVQVASDMFWKRWVREYLPLLSICQKWSPKLRNFKVGDLILIASDDAPRSSWPFGSITEVFVESNDIVRTVKLKTRIVKSYS